MTVAVSVVPLTSFLTWAVPSGSRSMSAVSSNRTRPSPSRPRSDFKAARASSKWSNATTISWFMLASVAALTGSIVAQL
jgi:hypothetical protein